MPDYTQYVTTLRESLDELGPPPPIGDLSQRGLLARMHRRALAQAAPHLLTDAEVAAELAALDRELEPPQGPAAYDRRSGAETAYDDSLRGLRNLLAQRCTTRRH